MDFDAVMDVLAHDTGRSTGDEERDRQVHALWQVIGARVGTAPELVRFYEEAAAGRGVAPWTRDAAARVLRQAAEHDPVLAGALGSVRLPATDETDLPRIAAAPPSPARRRSWRARVLVLAGVVVLLAGVALAAVWYFTPEKARPEQLLATGPDLACGVGEAFPPVCWWPEGGDAPMPAQNQSGDFHAIAVGGQTVCALRDDGEVYCWDPHVGLVEEGQAVPTPTTADHYSAITIGCGVLTGGSLRCWDPEVPAPPDGAYVAIGSGQYGALCAVRQDGTPVCWGSVDELTDAAPPSGPFVAVSVGGYHACGLREDGSVACWGKDEEGQATAPQGEFTMVTAGEEHSCGLRTDGTVACWGRDKGGQTTPPGGEFAVLGVSGGGEYTCATRRGGTVECWGREGRITAPDGGFRYPI